VDKIESALGEQDLNDHVRKRFGNGGPTCLSSASAPTVDKKIASRPSISPARVVAEPVKRVAEPLPADDTLFDEIIQNASVPVLIDFWADWCGPCRMAAPEIARAAAPDMAGKAIVLKVDTEKYPQIAARYNVRGIPN
jgi:thiol-disulfide isomerase/thioredoxin